MRKIINKRGGKPFTEPEARRIFKDMLLGMKEVVENNMVHRDLKPENVFVSDNKYKIADFGFCQFLKKPYEVIYSQYFLDSYSFIDFGFDGWYSWLHVPSDRIREELHLKM